MSIALVNQTAAATTSGGSATKTVTIPSTTSGNSLRLLISRYTGIDVTSPSGGGVTWSKVAEVEASSSYVGVELWVGENSSGGSTSVSFTLSNTYATVLCNISEWSGLDTAPVDDPAATTNTGTSSTIASSSVTPTAGKEVLLLAAGVITVTSLTGGPDGSFTALNEAAGSFDGMTGWGYRIVASASGSYQTNWTAGVGYQPWATIIAGWDAASGGGGGGSTSGNLLLLGVG